MVLAKPEAPLKTTLGARQRRMALTPGCACTHKVTFDKIKRINKQKLGKPKTQTLDADSGVDAGFQKCVTPFADGALDLGVAVNGDHLCEQILINYVIILSFLETDSRKTRRCATLLAPCA